MVCCNCGLEVGLVGVALFMVGFMSYMGRAIAYLPVMTASPRISGRLGASWSLHTFISNLTESDFLARNTIFWIVYVAVVATLGRRHVAAARSVATKPRRVLARPRLPECARADDSDTR